MEKSSANIDVVEGGGDDDVLPTTTVSFNDQHNSVANKCRHKKLMLVATVMISAAAIAVAISLTIRYPKGGIDSSSSSSSVGSISAATSEDTESKVSPSTPDNMHYQEIHVKEHLHNSQVTLK